MKFSDYRAKKERGENLETGTRDQRPKTVKFPKSKDNGRSALHEARWLRLPISDPTAWFKNVPLKREQIYRNLPFDFYGNDNSINDKTIAALHDRSLVLELKHFLVANATNNKPIKEFRQTNEHGSSTCYDILWDPPKNLLAIQEALNNYAMALHLIWPMDMTPIIMNRVLVKYHWVVNAKSEKSRLSCISNFFNDVLRSNVRKALNKKAPLDFDQQEKCLKAAMTRHEIPADVPLPSGGKGDHQRPGPSQQSNNQQGQKKQPKKKSDARYNNHPLCFAFNKRGRSCSNQTTATGCTPRPGIEYAHVCSKWVGRKSDFCYGNHAEENHR